MATGQLENKSCNELCIFRPQAANRRLPEPFFIVSFLSVLVLCLVS